MSAIRWIGGFIGWAAGGALGAIIGYLVGTLIEVFFEDSQQPGSGDSARQRRYSSQEQQNRYTSSISKGQPSGSTSFKVTVALLRTLPLVFEPPNAWWTVPP